MVEEMNFFYSWLGCKWTISLTFIAYMPFIAAQFYPTFYTMIPAGLTVGLGGGPLWCAKCTYLTVVSEAYASVSNLSADILVTRFFGLFFMFYQMAQVWGNLISSAGHYNSNIFSLFLSRKYSTSFLFVTLFSLYFFHFYCIFIIIISFSFLLFLFIFSL